jgi:hypothetical protein
MPFGIVRRILSAFTEKPNPGSGCRNQHDDRNGDQDEHQHGRSISSRNPTRARIAPGITRGSLDVNREKLGKTGVKINGEFKREWLCDMNQAINKAGAGFH